MRNLACIFLTILLFSCNGNDTTTPRTDTDSPDVKPTTQNTPTINSPEDFQTLVFNDLVYVPRDSAERMIANGRGAACKKADGVMTYFTKADMELLTNIPGVTGFSLEFACFGNVEGDRKNRPTILLAAEFSTPTQASVPPTPVYFTSRRICPPPDDCGRTRPPQ